MPRNRINSRIPAERLAAAREVGAAAWANATRRGEVNNHVHSIYSFSPYSPSLIAVKAAEAGLDTVGIMDHDSVSGCAEFLEACKAVGIASTIGCEVRVNMTGTRMEGRRTNNPDEPNITYMAFHGIPATALEETRAFLAPVHRARIARDRRQVDRLNAVLAALPPPPGLRPGALALDFDADILPLSEAAAGGSVTERHILYALSLKLLSATGRGRPLVDYLAGPMNLPLPAKLRDILVDPANPHLEYDLLGIFKSGLVPAFFLPSGPVECMPVAEAVAFAHRIHAIPAYPYLGDVGESPTGDKKAEKFEDGFLDELVVELVRLGFQAITYMPPRNTREQLARLRRLCQQHGLMEISGVDINSSRQSFNCPILLEPDFRHLTDAAWALIAHEKLAAHDARLALFHPSNPLAARPLAARITAYATVGRRMDPAHPERAHTLLGDGS